MKADICPVTETLRILGGKWKTLILWRLQQKTLRFNQLRAEIDGISQKMLTQQLRELEDDGVVARQIYAEVPPRVEYSLTDKGRSLCPILEAMCAWGKTYGSVGNPIDVARDAR